MSQRIQKWCDSTARSAKHQRTAPTSGLQQFREIAATKDLNKLQAFGKHRVVVASAQEIASLSFKKNACRDVYTEMF